MANFFEDLKRGKQGEIMVKNAFESMGYPVKDVSADPDFQKMDVDLVIDDCGTDRFLEVKADWNMGSTGNIVLELFKTNDISAKGWFNFTKSSHLAFVDMKNRIIYVCRTKELKMYIDRRLEEGKKSGYVEGIKDKILNGYYCYLLDFEKAGEIFQKVAA